MKIKAFPSLCIGLRECRKWAPDVYILDDNGCIDFHLMEVDPDHEAQARLGAELCPSHAIVIVED